MAAEWWSIERVFFTLFDYPMSYIEFVGTIFYLASVWLIAKRHMLTWPVGIVSVLLYMALFYQIRLYSDALEQIYYLGASFYGWWFWARSKNGPEEPVPVAFSSSKAIVAWGVVTAALSLVLGAAMTRVHLWLPNLFPEPASFPLVDALTTVMSFVAMWLMARRKTESWIYWIIVDLIGIWLYHVKGVKFISLLYVLLLILASRGLFDWKRSRDDENRRATANS